MTEIEAGNIPVEIDFDYDRYTFLGQYTSLEVAADNLANVQDGNPEAILVYSPEDEGWYVRYGVEPEIQENGHGFHTPRGDWPDRPTEDAYA